MENIESILSEDVLKELNPEGIEHNVVIDDVTEQDLFNEDDILTLSEGEAENVSEVEVESTEIEGE